MLKSSCSLIVWKKKAVSQQTGWVILGYKSCLKDAFFRDRGHDRHSEFIKDNEQSFKESKFRIEILLYKCFEFYKNIIFFLIFIFLVYFHLSLPINSQHLSTLIAGFCFLLWEEVLHKLISGTLNVTLERNLTLSFVWILLNRITGPHTSLGYRILTTYMNEDTGERAK